MHRVRRPAHVGRPGSTVRLSVDPARFHFFDTETGLAIGAAGARAGAGLMSKHHHKHSSFRVTWDGKTIAGVDRVSPLTRLVELITIRDGGSPRGGEHSAPGRVASEPVTLERPAGGDTAFEDWAPSARRSAPGRTSPSRS